MSRTERAKTSYCAQCELVRRDDAHTAVAGGDEDTFGAAADNADLGWGCPPKRNTTAQRLAVHDFADGCIRAKASQVHLSESV